MQASDLTFGRWSVTLCAQAHVYDSLQAGLALQRVAAACTGERAGRPRLPPHGLTVGAEPESRQSYQAAGGEREGPRRCPSSQLAKRGLQAHLCPGREMAQLCAEAAQD